MISERTLDLAVAAGVITTEQKARLAALEAASPPAPALVPGEDEEKLRLVSGFSDIFVTIGIGLFLGAVARGMEELRREIDQSIANVEDPLERLAKGIYAYLSFFRRHPKYTELLIQERAQFRDREQQTYFVHREKNRAQWRDLYEGLIADGRIRRRPVTLILDTIADLAFLRDQGWDIDVKAHWRRGG